MAQLLFLGIMVPIMNDVRKQYLLLRSYELELDASRE